MPRSRNAVLNNRIGSGLAVAAAGVGLLAAAPPAAAQTPVLTADLHQGSAGPNVARVQRKLRARATGRFGDSTRRSVLSFQRSQGLTVDGIVGPQTWDALFHITPTPTSSSSSASTSSSYGSGGYSVPSSVVQCESGGNYSAVNPSSGAGGAYQILPSTWQAYGGQGLPQNASPAEQNRIAAQIYANQGPSAWTC
jgi:peptidoglycan hydrolase-like protein with peptidoglycan-binding domain